MANFYKYVPQAVPAWAEALGVRSPAEMRFVIEEDGNLVFRPPRPEVLQKIIEEVRRKEAEAAQPVAAEAEQPAEEAEPFQENDFPELANMPASQPVPPPRSQAMPLNKRPSQRKTKKSSKKRGTTHRSSSLLIDLDSPPSWQPYSATWHLPGGQFYWDASKVQLYRSPHQLISGCFGTMVKTDLVTKQPYNANLIYWLQLHQHFIPVDWRRNGRRIFCWNTVFEDRQGNSCVMFLSFRRNQFITGYHPISGRFTSNDFACIKL